MSIFDIDSVITEDYLINLGFERCLESHHQLYHIRGYKTRNGVTIRYYMSHPHKSNICQICRCYQVNARNSRKKVLFETRCIDRIELMSVIKDYLK